MENIQYKFQPKQNHPRIYFLFCMKHVKLEREGGIKSENKMKLCLVSVLKTSFARHYSNNVFQNKNMHG